MKTNFQVIIKEQKWEEEGRIARFFNGIYMAIINKAINITFIPRFDHLNDQNGILRDDQINSVNDARMQIAMLSNYAVVEDNQKEGTVEVIESEEMGRTFFYVNESEFEIFKVELEEVLHKPEGITYTQHGDYQFLDTIVNRIIGAGYLTKYEMKIINM